MKPVFMVEIAAMLKDSLRVEPMCGIITHLVHTGAIDVVLWSTHYTVEQSAEVVAGLATVGWNIPNPGELKLRIPGDLKVDAAVKKEWLDTLDYFTRVRVSGVFEVMGHTVGRMLGDLGIPVVAAGLYLKSKKGLN